MRADLGRRDDAGVPRGGDEADADRGRGCTICTRTPGVGGEEQRPVDGLLLDERRARLVVGEQVRPPRRAQPPDVAVQQRVVLGVDEDEAAEARDRPHALEHLVVADVRVRRVRARHERLEARRALAPLALDVGEGGGRQRAPQPEVDHDLLGGHVALGGVEVDRGHRRVGERVLEDRREPAGGGRHRAGREVLALGVAGILEVGVGVDRAREHDVPAGVDHLVGARQHAVVVRERGDPPALDDEVRGEDAVVRGERAAVDDRAAHVAHG